MLSPEKQNIHNKWLDAFYQEKIHNDEMDSDLSDAVRVLYKTIEQFHATPNLEVEARLGFFESGTFDTDIGHEFFETILNTLKSFNGWSSVTEKKYADYYYNDMRMTVDQNHSNRYCIKKTKLRTLNFEYENSPFDIRIAFSREDPVELKHFVTSSDSIVRKKTRTSFIIDHWSFDLTKVQYVKDGLDKTEYQAELELLAKNLPDRQNPIAHNTVFQAFDMLLKTRDMVDMCEEEDDDEERNMVLIGSKSH